MVPRAVEAYERLKREGVVTVHELWRAHPAPP